MILDKERGCSPGQPPKRIGGATVDSPPSARWRTRLRCNATTPAPQPESARSENSVRWSGRSRSRILQKSRFCAWANTRRQRWLRSIAARRGRASGSVEPMRAATLEELGSSGGEELADGDDFSQRLKPQRGEQADKQNGVASGIMPGDGWRRSRNSPRLRKGERCARYYRQRQQKHLQPRGGSAWQHMR